MGIIQTKDPAKAAEYIKKGRVVAFPTGTSYGLAVDALQGHALQRLRNIKQRPAEKTFTIFLHPDFWDEYIDLSPQERQLLKRYNHTALTLLVSPKDPLKHLAQESLVGLRVIDHPSMESLARFTKTPLTATSANISGQDACYDAECIVQAFPGRIGTTYDLSLACILDGGTLNTGMISTIVRCEDDGTLKIIRQGSLMIPSSDTFG